MRIKKDNNEAIFSDVNQNPQDPYIAPEMQQWYLANNQDNFDLNDDHEDDADDDFFAFLMGFNEPALYNLAGDPGTELGNYTPPIVSGMPQMQFPYANTVPYNPYTSIIPATKNIEQDKNASTATSTVAVIKPKSDTEAPQAIITAQIPDDRVQILSTALPAKLKATPSTSRSVASKVEPVDPITNNYPSLTNVVIPTAAVKPGKFKSAKVNLTTVSPLNPSTINEQDMNLVVNVLDPAAYVTVIADKTASPVKSKTQHQRPATLAKLQTAQSKSQTVNEKKGASLKNIDTVLKRPIRHRTNVEADAAKERSVKNAINARLNRQRQKQHVQMIEEENAELRATNTTLTVEKADWIKEKEVLVKEINYLKHVIANETTLSNVLSSLSDVKNVTLTSTFAKQHRKRAADSTQRDDALSQKKQARMDDERVTGGICLHVDKNKVSLELCQKCAEMAASDTT